MGAKGSNKMPSLMSLRWLLSALGVLLGLAFIARGDYVIGALLITMSIARVVMFMQFQRRRIEMRQRLARRFDPDDGAGTGPR